MRLEVLETGVVGVPDGLPFRRNGFGLLELRPQERSRDLARKERAADVDPAVLVHLAAEELPPIGPLLLENVGPVGERRVVDQDRAALAAMDVLRLVEAERAEI